MAISVALWLFWAVLLPKSLVALTLLVFIAFFG
jgi:hypothetical protein